MMVLNQLSSWLTMGALDGIADAFTWGGIWLASGMYKVAMGIFQLFLILTTGKIINPSDLEVMISNFYIVIGVVMLFIIAFFLLKSMINPDDQSKSTSSIKKIIINLISSIIILAVLPTIFSFMFDVQDSVVNWNVFGKFFGYGDLNENIVEGNSYEMVKKQSYRLVNGVFTAFFNVDSSVNITSNDDLEAEQQKVKPNEKNIEVNTDKGSKPINSLESAIDYVNDTGKVSVYYNFSKAASGHEDYEGVKIDFDFLMCLIAGFIICYVGVSYCFDMAVRLIKLVFYQLIAPIPILLRIVPEGKLNGIFGQWLKVTITCYLEVFIRLFIFYFVVFMADRMTQPGTFLGEKVYEYGLLLSLLARAFTFLGLMMFMKQAPKLISEVTGFDSGNMKLGIMDKIKDSGIFNLASAGAGFVGGMIAGKGNPLAGFRAARQGWKNGNLQGIGSEVNRRREFEEARKNGVTRRQIFANNARGFFGLDTTADAEERKIKKEKQHIVNTSGVEIKYLDENGVVQTISADSKKTQEVDYQTIENMKAQTERRNGQIITAQQEVAQIEKLEKWNEQQKSLKSALDKDADTKWEEGKYSISVKYKDFAGNVLEESVDKKRFDEIVAQGGKFLSVQDKGEKFNIQYKDKEGNVLEAKDISSKEIDEIKRDGGIIEKQLESYYTADDVTTEARRYWTTHEINNPNGSGAKTVVEQFLKDLETEKGFSYKSFAYDKNGIAIRDENGNQKIGETGTYNSTIEDGRRVIIHEYETDAGKQEIKYKEIGGGMFEYVIDGKVHEIDMYQMASNIKKKSDANRTVLADEKSTIERDKIKNLREQNEASDIFIKQYEEKQKEQLKSTEQRAREAAKTYRANNNRK